MKKANRLTLHKLVWCKIRYFQQIHNITDEQLAACIDVHVRTLKEYDKHAENVTLGKVDNFLYANNLTLNDLLNT